MVYANLSSTRVAEGDASITKTEDSGLSQQLLSSLWHEVKLSFDLAPVEVVVSQRRHWRLDAYGEAESFLDMDLLLLFLLERFVACASAA